MVNLNLTSQIALNKVPQKLYQPATAVDRSELTRMEKIPTNIFASTEEGAAHIADAIESGMAAKRQKGEFYVMALGTGTSLTPVYQELIRRHEANGLSFKNLVVFNGYEYFPLTPKSTCQSLLQLKKLFLDHIDIEPQNVFSPNGTVNQDDIQEYCRLYEQRIQTFGGLDAALFGIGRTGNIAVNEPGSSMASNSRLILIDALSREEMSNSFATSEAVPPCSITMGMATILKAKKIFITAWGEEKAGIIKETVEGQITNAVPATFMQTHPDTHVVIDLSAAAELTRIKRPWLVTSCEWTDKLTRSALVWLCGITQKPILKLTNKDYNEHGLSELLALYGSAYNANIKIFNDLQHTITGWPGGKPDADDTHRPERATPYPKRALVFSPHPDDDVISMGGTIQRLVSQGHEVHVAYETSGNIAVNDEEVTRFMHFINGFNQLFNQSKDTTISDKYQEIKAFFKAKKAGDLDSRDVLTLKGLIRRGEARTACTFNKIPLEHVYFLDLPFYESGAIEKLPMTEQDVQIVRELLQKTQPHQIYVAADLADPHGTHRKCTDAVLAAIDLERQAGAKWLDDCRVWMYRGAWAEWDIENIEMCVPMSPEELRTKRNAILKHQSQMESAPFLGNDERLFWQRAEDRNRGTADLYDKLGLASYEAMEAFVEYKS
ncbi:glucosamine-6-phosphate deaminase [[Hallella] seregens]|uniref:Glucosamine-6-phosphate deaminase n=1 Tax=Hallella seregens ATCC 51272 TaxID=1336250 RepID=A0ABV5ZNY2_9BACT|nr:glucosamine-6-phosphate deaminase [Hallella seregens]